MRKISAVIILLSGFWAAGSFWSVVNVRADNEVAINNVNVVVNDEGYGNADAEYYNSADDVTNDDEPVPQENSLNNAQ